MQFFYTIYKYFVYADLIIIYIFKWVILTCNFYALISENFLQKPEISIKKNS